MTLLTIEKKIKKSSQSSFWTISTRVNSFNVTDAIATPVKIHPIKLICVARVSA
jgi:hypothetical protein